jgi:S-DNA-T family DNA segregation ATPase FtsK/SpoIIIE
MKDDSVGLGGMGLAGLGAAAVLWPNAPVWIAPVAVCGGAGLCVLGWYLNHYTELEKIFLNCQLYIRTTNDTIIVPRKIKTIHKNYGKDYILSLPQGLCLQQFKDKEPNISQAMDAAVNFEYNNGILIMSVKTAHLSKTYPFIQLYTEKPLEIVLGYSHTGLLTIDLSSSPSPHLGIFGETNGGKSVILRGLITQLILDNKPVELYLIDPKRVEFSIFKKSSFVKTLAQDDNEILDTLTFLCAETDRRYKLLEKAGCVNIKEYNKKHDMKYVLCIIDEYADLAENKDMNSLVNYIARKARAVGIHLILACQRPDKDILDGKIKANIGNILGLKTTTQVNSRVIIDKEGLENLRGFGHGILKEGSKYTEMQSMMITTDEVRKLIKHTFMIKKENHQKARGYIDTENQAHMGYY